MITPMLAEKRYLAATFWMEVVRKGLGTTIKFEKLLYCDNEECEVSSEFR